MAAPEKDPLSQSFDALWTILEANSGFTDRVPSRLRIKFFSTSAERRPERQARLPEGEAQVAVENVGGVTDMYWSSDGTHVDLRFRIWILTDERRAYFLDSADNIWKGILPLKWEILRALMDWETTTDALTWGSVGPFIRDIRCTRDMARMQAPRLEEQQAPIQHTGAVLAWDGIITMVFGSGALVPA